MKAMLLLVLLGSNLLLAGQDKEFLFQKGKKQKKAAVILLAAGGASALVGTVVFYSSADRFLYNIITEDKKDPAYVTGFFLMITGSAAIITSIPLFAASSRNLRKSQGSLSFDWKTVPVPVNLGLSNLQYPAVSFKYSL